MIPAGRDAWRPCATPATLRARARLLTQVRAFFADRGALEVEVPVLQGGANLDPGVEAFALPVPGGRRWLPTSPEHPLKRLVAAGLGDVWSLAPSFRAGEQGRRHAPEFRMLEWYRCGWDHQRLLDETVLLLQILTGLDGGIERLSWRACFRKHAGLDPVTADDAAWRTVLGAQTQAVCRSDGSIDPDLAADLVFAERVEPWLGCGHWTAVLHWPPRLAAQARLGREDDGQPAAERFEIFRDGLELANGYHELVDASELAGRLAAEQGRRREAPERDQRFVAAMEHGLPGCAGVALGFDRVVMVALGLDTVAETMAFPWELA